ncbi:uncharacterized protein havcr2 [Odontesthes bonariensis]|uniref:uncharacterized protein LOC142401627 n=1 Tax=Odontesthes bonariensis TaxID=219752 RepID=UPI003F5849FB
MLLLHASSFVLLLSVVASVSAVAKETVVGVAGEAVTLPCRSGTVRPSGVEVCWGTGEPSVFNCHNTLINGAGDHIKYRRSHRYSLSSSSSLSISDSQLSDTGFYHCRVQLPGLFNDQTSSVHLIIISPLSVVSENSDDVDVESLNSGAAQQTGSDVTGGNSTEPMVAEVQSHVGPQDVNTLQIFVGNTLRVSFIIFVPALLLTAAYRGVCRSKKRFETTERSEEEEEDSSV